MIEYKRGDKIRIISGFEKNHLFPIGLIVTIDSVGFFEISALGKIPDQEHLVNQFLNYNEFELTVNFDNYYEKII